MPFVNRFKDKFSLATLIFLVAGIILLRLLTLLPNELSWDVLGYYLHLPAFFIYHDHGLNDIGWIQQLMDQYDFTATLYQIGRGPAGGPIFFFLMGMSLFYLPWFLIAQLAAPLLGFPADGFSLPYQYILAMGNVTYTIIALVYLRKILLSFFSDKLSSLLLIILVAGTNYLHFVTVKNLETANILFMLVVLVVYNTLRWHQSFKLKNLLAIAVFTVLASLVKPSEVLIVFIPLLWGIYNKQSFYAKFQLLKNYRKQLLIGIGMAFVIALPQMIYWYSETGYFIYDSYKNPAVGLDFFAPHIFNVLFSFKKGWLLYTPIMGFSIAGLFVLYKRNRAIFMPLVIYCAIAFYLLASWTEWWYGASYSSRPMITLYPLLLIAMGYFFMWLGERKVMIKAGVRVVVVFFIFLNLFQTWQFNNYVLDAFGTTKAYYFAVFGKTKISHDTRKLLSMQRPFKGDAVFIDPENYNSRILYENNFENADTSDGLTYSTTPENGKSLYVDGEMSYISEFKIRYKDLTRADHLWIRAKVDILLPEGYEDALPTLALMFDRREGSYDYHSYPVDTIKYKPGTWATIQIDYLTPFIRSRRDYFKCHVHNQGNSPFLVDNFRIEIFEPKAD